jgi:hypothetical protein
MLDNRRIRTRTLFLTTGSGSTTLAKNAEECFPNYQPIGKGFVGGMRRISLLPGGTKFSQKAQIVAEKRKNEEAGEIDFLHNFTKRGRRKCSTMMLPVENFLL